jgi:hypothetical protein
VLRSSARSSSTISSGCVAASIATRPSSKSHGVSPATTTIATATTLLPVSRLASNPSSRIAVRTSTAENARATWGSAPVTAKTPASRYG